MATPEDLDRLRALLTQLTQIGSAQRGELIRAEDWNGLVRSVADIARAVLAADASPVIPPHDHLDQVTQEWLVPQLRDLLERGGLSDPAVQNRLSQIEQTLSRFSQKLDSNESKVEDFRGRITDVASRDLVRESAIANVRRAIDNVADPRPDIQAMRASLGVIQKDITTVQEIASRLSVDGVTVDVGQVVTRVNDLEQFRDRFRAANGELLDATTIERRLAEVSTRNVSQDQLTEALANVNVAISQDQIDGLQTRFETASREQVNAVLDNFRGEVNTTIGTRLGDVATLVSQNVNIALPGLTASITSTLNQHIDASERAAADAAVAVATRMLDDREKSIRADMATQLSDVTAGIIGSVRTEVSLQLATGLAGVTTGITATNARIDQLATVSNKQTEQLEAQAAATAQITQDNAALRVELRTLVRDEIGLQVSAINRSIDDRFTAFQKAQDDTLTAMAADIRTVALDAARKVAQDTATAASQATRTQVLAEMRSVAREEATILVRDQVRLAVTDAVKEHTASIPGLIATEIRRTTGTTLIDRIGRVVGGGNP
jgi:hypothetical protein